MFILIESADRELNAEKYDTFKEAQEAMLRYYNEAGDCETGEFFTYEAYKNNTHISHAYFDWKIVEL